MKLAFDVHDQSGEKNPRARLTADQVIKGRELRHKRPDLGIRYAMDNAVVPEELYNAFASALRGRTWQHIETEPYITYKCVTRQTTEQRKEMALLFISGKTEAEIAEKLGVNLRTVHRAVEKYAHITPQGNR